MIIAQMSDDMTIFCWDGDARQAKQKLKWWRFEPYF